MASDVTFIFCLQGFLTAVLQNHARLTQAPIDQLSFGFDVLAVDDAVQLATPPEIGVCVSGLHLEGARYGAAHVLCSTYSALTVLCSTDSIIDLYGQDCKPALWLHTDIILHVPINSTL